MNSHEQGTHKAKLWEIICFALNDVSTNLYLYLFNYIAYFLTGIVGVAVVTAGTIATTMRMWDAVTDPFIGYFVDKTNGKFGKNRPFIIMGNLIMFVTSFILFKVTPNLSQGARFPFYIVMYMLYIIGYTCQCVVTKSGQSCLTNDPKQRPIFTMVTSTGNLGIRTIMPIVIISTLIPAMGGQSAAFTNPDFFMAFWVRVAFPSMILAALAVIGLWRKDRPEYFGTGIPQKVNF